MMQIMSSVTLYKQIYTEREAMKETFHNEIID